MTKSKMLTTSRKALARVSGMRKFFRSKATLGCLSLSVVYCIFCNVQLERGRQLTELLLNDHRTLVRELITQTFDNGDCDIGSPTEEPILQQLAPLIHYSYLTLDLESVSHGH